MAKVWRYWTSNNSRDEPPKDCPVELDDGLTQFERMAERFRRAQGDRR